MSQTVIFMIIRLVTLSVNIFLCNWTCALTSESLFQIRKGFAWFLIKFVLKMNSRKKGTGSEVNITLIWFGVKLLYSWSIWPNFRVVQYGFLLHFDIDNCLLKKFQQIRPLLEVHSGEICEVRFGCFICKLTIFVVSLSFIYNYMYYIQLLLQLCTEVSQVTTQWTLKIEKWQVTHSWLFFARSAKNLDSRNFSLPCRAANDFRWAANDFPILACAANDFTVSHETNSLPGNKMYVARLKKFSLQKELTTLFTFDLKIRLPWF
jgi:hypothetical protein